MLDKGKLDHKTQKLLSREIEAMEEVHHPSILRLYEVIETLSTQYFVMEYAAGELNSVVNNAYSNITRGIFHHIPYIRGLLELLSIIVPRRMGLLDGSFVGDNSYLNTLLTGFGRLC